MNVLILSELCIGIGIGNHKWLLSLLLVYESCSLLKYTEQRSLPTKRRTIPDPSVILKQSITLFPQKSGIPVHIH